MSAEGLSRSDSVLIEIWNSSVKYRDKLHDEIILLEDKLAELKNKLHEAQRATEALRTLALIRSNTHGERALLQEIISYDAGAHGE